MSSTEIGAVMALGLMVGLCFLIARCLRDTLPCERADILRALADVLRSLWPWPENRSRDRDQ